MAELGRNDPCPCGSGLKYKKCCIHKRRRPAMAGGLPAQAPSSGTRYQGLIALALIVIVSVCAYYNSFQVPFVFDDGAHIVNNRGVHIDELSPERIDRFWESTKEKGRAVAQVSFAFNYYLGKLDTFGYHLFNLIVHILTALALYSLIRRSLSFKLPGETDESGQPRYASIAFQVALISSLIFTAHPVNSQAVTYIVQRMTSLGALFFIASLLAYIKGRQNGGAFGAYCWFAASFIGGLLAINSKQNTVTLPLFILLYEIYFFQGLDWRRIRNNRFFTALFALIPVLIIGIAFLSTSGNLINHVFVEGYKGRPFNMWQRLLTQFRVVVYYFSLLFYPHPSRLNLDYDYPISYSFIDPPTTLLCFFLLLGLMGLGFYLMRRRPVISFCILWFFGNLVIESSIYPLDLVYEHRLYLPFLGFICPLAIFFIEAVNRFTPARAVRLFIKTTVLAGVLGIFCLWTYQRNQVWHSVISLLEDVVAKSPGKSRQHVNLGVAYSSLGQLDKAIACYKKGIELDPNYPETYNNLGNAYNRKGMLEEAIQEYQKAIQMRYKYKEAHNNLGSAYYKQGKLDKAIEEHLIALQIQDDCEKSLNNLGVAYSAKKMYPEAIESFKKAIASKPDFPKPYINLSLTYTLLGEPRKAVEQLETVRYLEPGNPSIFYNLGNAYSDLGDLDKAAAAYKTALRLEPKYPAALNNLGLVYRQQKKDDEAIGVYRRAIGISPNQAEFYYNLGLIYSERGEDERAVEYFQQAIARNPNIDRVHFDLAALWEKRGQYKDAVREYEQTVRLSPGHLEAYQRLADIYLRHFRDKRKARLYLQRAYHLARDPKQKQAFQDRLSRIR